MSWSAKGNVDEVLKLLETELTRSYRGPVEAMIIQGQIEMIGALPSAATGFDWRVQAYGHVNVADERSGSSSNAAVDARIIADGQPSPF